LDPVYVMVSFVHQQQETLNIPQGFAQIVQGWNARTHSAPAKQVDNSFFLFSFPHLIDAVSFQAYVAGRLNTNTLRVRVFSSIDMMTF
jgi:hypothetical protein